MKKRIGSILIAAALCAATLCAAAICTAEPWTAEAASGYSDVKPGDWYYDAVTAVSEAGIVAGDPDGSFRPEDPVTYAEFITMAVKAVTGGELSAVEAPGHWAYHYYKKAREEKMFTWEDIDPGLLDRAINRTYMALICSNILGDGADISGEYYSLLKKSIKDLTPESIYVDEIIRSYGAGVLSGYPDHTFRPSDTLQRCEAASVILRLMDKDSRNAIEMDKLRETVAQMEDQERVQTNPGFRNGTTVEERVANIVQNGAKPVVFRPGTDEMKDQDGRTVMKIDKAGEYLENALSTLKFYGSGGKYYFTITMPELPEGYRMFASAEVRYRSKPDRPSWYANTITENEKTRIPDTGTVTREITGMDSPADVNSAGIMLAVDKIDDTYFGSYDVAYMVQWDHDGKTHLALLRGNTEGEASVREEDYNGARHFTWQ